MIILFLTIATLSFMASAGCLMGASHIWAQTSLNIKMDTPERIIVNIANHHALMQLSSIFLPLSIASIAISVALYFVIP